MRRTSGRSRSFFVGCNADESMRTSRKSVGEGRLSTRRSVGRPLRGRCYRGKEGVLRSGVNR